MKNRAPALLGPCPDERCTILLDSDRELQFHCQDAHCIPKIKVLTRSHIICRPRLRWHSWVRPAMRPCCCSSSRSRYARDRLASAIVGNIGDLDAGPVEVAVMGVAAGVGAWRLLVAILLPDHGARLVGVPGYHSLHGLVGELGLVQVLEAVRAHLVDLDPVMSIAKFTYELVGFLVTLVTMAQVKASGVNILSDTQILPIEPPMQRSRRFSLTFPHLPQPLRMM